MNKYIKKYGIFASLLIILLSACGQTPVASETATGDYVAPALAVYDIGSSLGTGIFWAVAALIVGLVIGFVIAFYGAETRKGSLPWLVAIAGALVSMTLVFGIPAAAASYIVIDPGHVGVVVDQGKAQNTPLLEGPHWITPFYQTVRVYSTRPFTFSLVTDGENGESPATKGSEQYRSFYQKFTTVNGVDGKAAYIIQASLDPQAAPQFYRDYGTLENGIVQLIKTPAIPLVRDVFRGMTAEEAVTNIDDYNDDVQIELAKIAEAGGLIFIDFSFSRPNMGVWGDERNLTATTAQQALTEANKVQIAEAQADASIATQAGVNQADINAAIAQAEIAITKAQGEADAIKIGADANAYKITTEAEAEAEANLVVAQSLNEQLINYRRIMKWDGALPMYFSGAGGPVFTIPIPQ